MRIGNELAKGYLAADFREALQRYFTRTQADQKSDPPSSDSGATSPPPSESGATRDGEQKQSEDGGPTTEESGHGKDESGEAEAA